MQVIMIVATSSNGVIGVDGKLPWHHPEDLKRFKELTTGHVVIMGRGTFESIGSKPLPNRVNVVLSRSFEPLSSFEGYIGHNDLGQALQWFRAMGKEKCFIIGGSEIYKEAEQYADTLLLTEVGDVVLRDDPSLKIHTFYWHQEVWDCTRDTRSGELRFLTFRKTPKKNFMQEDFVNFEDIQRFNQGFGGFGPLEKCSTGKLMKTDDVEELVESNAKVVSHWAEVAEDRRKVIAELEPKLADTEARLASMTRMKDFYHDSYFQMKGQRDGWKGVCLEANNRTPKVCSLLFVFGLSCGAALTLFLQSLI